MNTRLALNLMPQSWRSAPHHCRVYTRSHACSHNVAGLVVLLLGIQLSGCQSSEPLPPIRTASYVDLERFMGDWYVLGNIPTLIERQAFNAVESYELLADGTVATTFRFNKGALDGPEKIYHPTGFVRDTTTNAEWGMQFIWPIKAEYRVVFVSASYDQCVIGRTKRDYLWIMARTPSVSEADFQALVDLAEAEGYDPAKIRRVPHGQAETAEQ